MYIYPYVLYMEFETFGTLVACRTRCLDRLATTDVYKTVAVV